MSFKSKGHKENNNLSNRFWKLKNTIMWNFQKNRYRLSDDDIKMEKEFAFMIAEIERYGFSFFAEHYVGDMVNELEALAHSKGLV